MLVKTLSLLVVLLVTIVLWHVFMVSIAKWKMAKKSLIIKGKAPKEEILITTPFYKVMLMKGSGNIYSFILANKPIKKIYNKIGPIHWNPDVWSPHLGRKWQHTYQWNPPPILNETRTSSMYEIRRKGRLPEYDEVEVEVRYRFSAIEPYILVESTIKILKDIKVRALRNGECVFAPGLFTHASCKKRNGKINTWELIGTSSEGEIESPAKPDDKWLLFYNPKTGIGMATIHLNVENKGPAGKEAALVDYRMQIDVHKDYSYWSRALVYPKGPVLDELYADVKAGNIYIEKEAWLPFMIDGRLPWQAVETLCAELQE